MCVDLCGLDLTDGVKGSIVLTDAERDGQLATTGDRVDSEGSVTGGDGYQVGKDADGFGLVTLSRRGVVRTSHDDCKLDLEAELE